MKTIEWRSLNNKKVGDILFFIKRKENYKPYKPSTYRECTKKFIIITEVTKDSDDSILYWAKDLKGTNNHQMLLKPNKYSHYQTLLVKNRYNCTVYESEKAYKKFSDLDKLQLNIIHMIKYIDIYDSFSSNILLGINNLIENYKNLRK